MRSELNSLSVCVCLPCFLHFRSLLVELSYDELQGLLVGDHALVGLLHLESGHRVDVGPRALPEALRQRLLVEQVSVEGDRPEVIIF